MVVELNCKVVTLVVCSINRRVHTSAINSAHLSVFVSHACAHTHMHLRLQLCKVTSFIADLRSMMRKNWKIC